MLKLLNFHGRNIASKSILLSNGSFLTLPFNQNRTLTSKKYRVKKPKPAPFPYWERNYNWFWNCIDHTYKRFDENTKLIVIEGPVASGKHEAAKKLAAEFDLKYVPDITMDYEYINEYGFDMRNLNHKIPESNHTFDENDFCRDPFHFNTASFQAWKYKLRFMHYWHILEHILSTGQGVVTVRSPFSNHIFVNALRQCNYISEAAKFANYQFIRHTIFYLFRPHLIIYLDVPVDKTLENIKARNRDAEVNGKALTPEYLRSLEDGYKSLYLREASIHSMVLHYNWIENADVEILVEDIERLDFEKYLHEDCDETKLCDWRLEEIDMDWERMMYGNELHEYLNLFNNVHVYDAPEMLISGEDHVIFDQVWSAAPGSRYAHGYNPDRGDNVWFKFRRNKAIEYRDLEERR